MSIHEIKYQSCHNYIHLPTCGKSLMWRIRRFFRQVWTEVKILFNPPKCICRTATMNREPGTVNQKSREGLFNERGFPTDKWFDQLDMD